VPVDLVQYELVPAAQPEPGSARTDPVQPVQPQPASWQPVVRRVARSDRPPMRMLRELGEQALNRELSVPRGTIVP
jgi:hypothetical protein